jgi:hypothetical protein
MTAAVATWSRRGGTALAVLGVAWVALRLARYGDELGPARLDGVVWLSVIALAGLHAAANALLALAWQGLLGMQGAHRTRAWSVRVQGVSQLAKYVPGNVMHFASRQLLAAADGVPHGVLVRAAVYEVAGLAFAGLLLSLWALPLIGANLVPWITPLGGAVLILLAPAVVWLTTGGVAARVLVSYLLFLLAVGLGFTWLLGLLAPDAARVIPWPAACGAYVAAWLAGFVTPGAPAGLGVREIVLLFLLDGQAAEQDLLPAIVLCRGVAVAGDTAFFGVAAWSGPRPRMTA